MSISLQKINAERTLRVLWNNRGTFCRVESATRVRYHALEKRQDNRTLPEMLKNQARLENMRLLILSEDIYII